MPEPSDVVVSCVMPAYREEEHIAETIDDVVSCLRAGGVEFEIVVVLDVVPGDATGDIVHEKAKTYKEVRIVERLGKRGVGDAVKAGFGAARGRVMVPVMADHSESGKDLLRLVSVGLQGYDVTVADRFGHGKPPGYPLAKFLANRLFNVSARFLLTLPTTDITNAFKAYSKDALDSVTIRSKGFEVFLELPAKTMALRNCRTATVKVGHFARKKKEPKLALSREGPRYAGLLLRLLLQRKENTAPAGRKGAGRLVG